MTDWSLPALQGGGLVLGYRCPARCRHCLYGCGPHRHPGAAAGPEALERVLAQLAQRAPDGRFHIGGGEPFLDQELLRRAVAGFRRHRLTLEYVETNAAWVRGQEQAEAALERLAEEGLRCVLVSLSPFHAEFVPLGRTLALVRAAERVLPEGAFLWMPTFLADLEGQPQDTRLDLETYLAARGQQYAQRLAERYALVPNGRAGRFLLEQGRRLPWRDAAATADCARRLRDTSHFHVDLAGRFVPGLCPGLVLPLNQVPGRFDLAPYPLLRALVQGGPAALYELAEPAGFQPHQHYSSACDFCSHLRHFFHGQGTYAELGPEGYYDPRSVSYADSQ